MTVHLYLSDICWVSGLTLTTAEAWVLFTQMIYSSSSFSLCLSLFFFKLNMCLVAQLVNNQPAMQETPVRFLGREDSLEEG